MSYQDFKEVNINNPGTASAYGADDILELMKIYNGKVVSNRLVQIKNPWQWQDYFDVVAASVIPANPSANTRRLYVDPADNHLKMRTPAGVVTDIDLLGQGSIGEANIGANVGVGGQGFYKGKSSETLQFRNINAGSSKITISLDSGNDEIDVDVAEGNLALQNISGILSVSKGGTGVNSLTTNALLKGAGSSNVAFINPGTDGHILTMVSGSPAWAAASASADVKTAVFENGTQVGSTGRRLNFSESDDFTIAEDAGNDWFTCSLVRSEVLVGSWFAYAGYTKTNIGTSYVDLFSSSSSEGNGCDVDATGKNNFRFYCSWSKNFGAGTHSIQVKDQSTSDILATISDLSSGKNVTTGSIPSYFADNVRSVKLQAKSTVSTDDPIFRGAHIWFK